MPHRDWQGSDPGLKLRLPSAFGLYMAGGYCAHQDLRGISTGARCVAVVGLQESSLW